MKNNPLLFFFTLIIFAILISGCTTVGTATSWPGLKASDDLAYVSFGNYVYSIKLTDGSLAWRFPQQLDKNLMFFAPPALDNNVLVFGNYNNILYCVDSKTGVEKWRFTGGKDRYIAGALIYHNSVYAPNADRHLYTLDSNGKLLWKFKTQNANWSKPVTDGEFLYFGSMDHFAYALKLNYSQDEIGADEKGERIAVQKPIWSVNLETAIFADPLLSNQGILYFVTLGGKVIAVSPQNGEILWSYPKEGKLGGIWDAPVLVGENLYVADETGKIYALSAITGAQIWPMPYEAGAPVIGGGVALGDNVGFVTTNGKFFVLNSKGEVSWTKSLNASLYTAPQTLKDQIILAVVAKDNLLTSFDQNGREFWNFNPYK